MIMSIPSGKRVSVAGDRELALKGRRRSQCSMDVAGSSVGKRAWSRESLCEVAACASGLMSAQE